jgi:acetolactate synthase regulatory subunit
VLKWGEKRSQGIQRYCVTSPRTYSLDVIAFDQPMLIEHVVRIVDISVIGVGIESSDRIEPGLICFKEQVSGQKYGVLIWSKPSGDRHRAGIQFVVLSPEEEAYLQEQVKQSHPCQSIRDPDKIIASLLDSFKNEPNR